MGILVSVSVGQRVPQVSCESNTDTCGARSQVALCSVMKKTAFVLTIALFVANMGCVDSREGVSNVMVEGVSDRHHLLASEADNGRAVVGFKLSNQTRVPVTLELILVSCVCAEVVVDGQPLRLHDQLNIEGGAQREIEFVVKTTTRSRVRSVAAAMRESDRETLWLTGSVEVHDDVGCVPSSLIIDDLASEGEDITKVVRFNYTYRGTIDEELSLSLIKSAPDIDVSIPVSGIVEHVVDDLYRMEWECTVDIAPKVGRGDVVVGIYRGRERSPVQIVSLPVLVNSRPTIITPVKVGFGVGPPHVLRRRMVSLVSRDGMPFSILAVHATTGAFAAQVAHGGRSNEHVLDVTFTPPNVGSHTGSLHITLDHPEVSSLDIEVGGYAMSR
jgi:hypothetical protein